VSAGPRRRRAVTYDGDITAAQVADFGVGPVLDGLRPRVRPVMNA